MIKECTKYYDTWNPSIGESLAGHILYFYRPDGSFMAFMRTKHAYLLLPKEACEAFMITQPEDGALVTITLTDAGYRWS